METDDDTENVKQQQASSSTTSKGTIQERTCQISQDELHRLLQDEAMKLPDLGICMSGMAGRFPKADSIFEYEECLRQCLDMANDQDESRFQCGLWGLPPRAGRLKDLSRFDHEFFGYSQEDANFMDFQLRILYEVVYESILDAGVNPSSLRGTNTGVFFGLHCNEFENALADDPAFKTNGYYAQFAVKIAQYFDLHGITLTFDAACASAFVGLHSAVEALREGLIDQAIVCSSNIPIHPTGSFIFFQMQMLSPSGYSRFLDSRADGYVKSEACVSVLLQRKHLARRNYCSFLATMTSVDGYKPEGITFPSDLSQESLIRNTKELAQLSTNHVEYLEAHGTGTPAGDPQEARAISNVYYAEDNDDDEGQTTGNEKNNDKRIIGPLLVGSVKTNMGHSEAASGLCALAKVALMLENELIYGSLHFSQPNTNIRPLIDGRLKFVSKLQPLKAKIIPMSCYGFGGSNVHIIVRANECNAIDQNFYQEGLSNKQRLIVMFGRNEHTLGGFFDEILNRNQYNTRNCLTDDFLTLVDSLSVAKIDRLMNYRGFLVVDQATGLELARSIAQCDLKPIVDNHVQTNLDIGHRIHLQEAHQRACHLLFSGLESRPANLIRFSHIKQFWSTIERLNIILAPFHDRVNLLDPVYYTSEKINISQLFVSIIAHEVALINIVRDQLKLQRINRVLGHSLGEIACAYATGTLDERQTILVAYELGSACDEMHHLIAGKMVAVVGLSLDLIELAIQQYSSVCIACKNAPNSVTISGRKDEIEDFCARQLSSSEANSTTNKQVLLKQVSDQLALHNKVIMGQPEVRSRLTQALERVLLAGKDFSRDSKSWRSSFVDGQTMKQANVEYFVRMLCSQIDFESAFNEELFEFRSCHSGSILLDLGPSGQFESMVAQRNRNASNDDRPLHYVKLLNRNSDKEDANLLLAKNIGLLYQAGANFDLSNFYQIRTNGSHVRRRTPSLGALMRWRHDAQLFVPRYPAQFGKSSAKCEMPIDLVHDRDKFLAGHCIEGRVLYPATGYLFLIWRVFSFTKRKIYDACFHDVERELVPIEFHNVRLMRAIILGNRVAQIYIQIEEATGKFEIKEGGSVVAEGWARSPSERPQELLYDEVRERISSEKLEMAMSKEDVYKQFRINGYDYGPSFQNIEECSADGRFCRVKFNGHFVALTDSVLQSIFLAVADYAPTSGGLFLPTRFEYVRFQPELILNKLHACRWALDLSDGSLNTRAKREMMNKMLQRESEVSTISGSQSQRISSKEQASGNSSTAIDEEEKQPLDCYFDTYCDPATGVIITDGIEMRGIKASPAPRRVDNTSELLLESQQFVADFEMPVQDQSLLVHLERSQQTYLLVCEALASKLLTELGLNQQAASLVGNKLAILTDDQIAAYKAKHLVCDYEKCMQVSGDSSQQQHYNIKKNGKRTLLSVLDQLVSLMRSEKLAKLKPMKKRWPVIQQTISEHLQENRTHLMQDLLQEAFTSERFLRPFVEQVIENIGSMKSSGRLHLKMLEVNLDDCLVGSVLDDLIGLIEPQLALDYALAHPDPSRLHGSQISPSTKTYTLKSAGHNDSMVHSLFRDNQQQLRQLDLIVFKDVSCYSLPKQIVEENGLSPVVCSLASALKLGGYCILMMRESLTMAELIPLALAEPELVGLNKLDMEQLRSSKGSDKQSVIAKLEKINDILMSRCKMMLAEAEQNQLLCVGRKGDQNGCLLMLFRKISLPQQDQQHTLNQQSSEEADNYWTSPESSQTNRLILRVQHENLEAWFQQLKENFIPEVEQPTRIDSGAENHANTKVMQSEQQTSTDSNSKRTVWLCAVLTKQSQLSGIIGMMQALRRELGSTHLRCFYDEFTFRLCDDHKVDANAIEQSHMFQLALKRNQLWFCVDQFGRVGSYRHLTINNLLSPDECLCSNQNSFEWESSTNELTDIVEQQQKDAYVNNVTRGDLSSFAWHEAPFKYLKEEEQNQLVQVAYSALNFRDIMLASGRLPLDAIPLRLAQSDCLLGLEFAGLDANQKRVMGMVYGRGLATRVICPPESSLVLEIPDWLTLKEAATIPVAYATAIMALIFRGRARSGESILIHAGSGGVGQAALHLAAHLKMKAFTTVGTQEKRDFLLQQFGHVVKEDCIFSSRDCSFEQDILRATSGRGVDLVLNSLADDKLQASINCLADGGRFLEIGKYDMSMDSQLELLKLEQNKSFHGILLDKLFDVDDISLAFREQLKCVHETLQLGLKTGFIKPLRFVQFECHQIEQAFRFMATGKHIGKVLIEVEPNLEKMSKRSMQQISGKQLKCLSRFQLDSSKAYIVTGALGGFGLELCKWLVGVAGARHLVLTSRQGPKTGYQKAVIRRLEGNGCSVRVVCCEEADPAAGQTGARKLCQIARSMAPSGKLGAIFHLAMVLRDSLLENMSTEDFEQVCVPKLEACKNLDAETLSSSSNGSEDQLDYFVAFSSVTSGKGNAGQANYAYANSCLERICERRRSRGLHGLAIQWGVIGDVGVAFERLGGNSAVIGGTLPQRIPSCMMTLGKLLCSPFAVCSSILPVHGMGGQDGRRQSGQTDLVGAIMHVLGIKDSSKVSDDSTLGDLGLDSLMAVEIRQYIEREYDMTLNIQEIRLLTIAKIRHISETCQPVQSQKAASSGAASRKPGESLDASAVKDQVNKGGFGGQEQTNKIKIRSNGDEAAKIIENTGESTRIDKSIVASFVPCLELPKEDFVRLNFKNFAKIQSNCTSQALSASLIESNRPIFFIPPIHGRFDQLEVVCSSIRRPCIGLNWTSKLGCQSSMSNVVETYLEVLQQTDWVKHFSLPLNNDCSIPEDHIVDLVGYSFGATVAFELMLAIHERASSPAVQNGHCGSNCYNSRRLLPGQLVLLDGSPHQIELGSQFLSDLTKRQPLKLEDKVDELLMVYVVSNLSKRANSMRSRDIDYLQLQSQLKQIKQLELKIKFASSQMARLLVSKTIDNNDNNDEDLCRSIGHAMEAFCRKYELINNYKAKKERKLPEGCTLIRAEKLYLISGGSNNSDEPSNGTIEPQLYNQDLGLSTLVNGQVELHVLRGDHETFLNANHRSISQIISRNCSR